MARSSRRKFLEAAGRAAVALPVAASVPLAGSLALTATGCEGAVEPGSALGPEGLFSHGVASGDPTADAVVLWTHVSAPAGAVAVDISWEVALDAGFASRVAEGQLVASAASGWTAKVDVTGLAAHTTYHYRFRAMQRESPAGRTRTAPAGPLDRLRFAVVSCSNYTGGWFHAYRDIAARADLDAVIGLGDYIYEGGEAGAIGRPHEPDHVLVTLDDYRTRYAQYRGDPDLQELHRVHPYIGVWDDHEMVNNVWREGAERHRESAHGPFVERAAAALQAWREWMPVRDTADVAAGRIYREVGYGDLVTLLMLDTRRVGRDEQVEPDDRAGLLDPARTLLGAEQEAWLEERLAASTARWVILGQQVMVAPMAGEGAAINNDQWDGYQAARGRLYDAIDAHAAGRTVVLTGDIHSSWAADLPRSAGEYDAKTGVGSVAVEVVCPGVTSRFPFDAALAELLLRASPHFKWLDAATNGYVVLDVTPERVQAAWQLYEAAADPDAVEAFGAAWSTAWGTGSLTEDDAPA